MEENNRQIEELVTKVRLCEEEIGKAIIGQQAVVRQVLLAVLTDGNVLLEGVPGLGKTQLVKTLARVLQLSFSRIQFTPDLMPADVTGTNLIVRSNNENQFRFEPGPIFAGIVLADEINRATPKTQSALLEAMQEKTVTVGKNTYRLPNPFMVVATQNPIEHEGTYPLPEAQLDRFLFKLEVGYPNLDEMRRIMDVTITNKQVSLKPVLTGDDITRIRHLVRDIPIAQAVYDYALKLILSTHPTSEFAPELTKKYIRMGASPRAAQAVILTAQAKAFVEGRLNVSFEDIRFVAIPALRHRLSLNFEAMSDGISLEQILQEIVSANKEIV